MNNIRLSITLCLGILLNCIGIKAQTYATLPFTETFETPWVNKDAIRDVPSVYWNNTPATGNNSWSRDDDGVARGAWSGNNFWPNNPAAANGSIHAASFGSGEADLSGTLDLYVNFASLSGLKALYFWYINTAGDDKLEISISTDGGTTFGSPITTLYTLAVWTKICLDLGNLTSPTGVIRFKGIHVLDFSSPISIDNVYVGAHSSTPIVADFSAEKTSGIAPLTVNFTNKSTGDVTNWSWDFNTDGIVDDTTQNPTHTFFTVGTTTVKLISSKPGYSASKTIEINTTPQVYASLPFIEDFDHTWVNREGTLDVPSLQFKNTPATGDNSWRKNEDGWSGEWTEAFQTMNYTTSGAKNSHYSARFHSYVTNLSGTLDVFIDFSTQTGNKTLSFWYVNSTGQDGLELYLSTDGGVTFGPVFLTTGIQEDWEKVTCDLGNITSSTGVIRFKTFVEYDNRFNGTDIGIDDIRVSNPTEIPIDAFFTTDRTSGQSPLTVNFADKSGGTPTSWKWDFDNDGVIDTTAQNPSHTYSTPGTYTVKLQVANSNYSEEIIRTNIVLIPDYAELPYFESFESDWGFRDNNRDVPTNFWKGKPSTGNNSWSREDDGVFRGAWSSLDGAYSPSGANGSEHSASFNSRDTYLSGNLDLFVNFVSQTGEKRLSFWYINTGGTDRLKVYLSTDDGSTFKEAIAPLGISSEWTKYFFNLGDINSPIGVIRFCGSPLPLTWDFTGTNIGIDDINVVVPALLPLKADFSSNIVIGNAPLTVNFSDQSDGAPESWSWDFNNDGIPDSSTQNPSFTYTSNGIYTVNLMVSKAGSSNTEVKTGYINVGYLTGLINENFPERKVSVYPNPAGDHAVIKLENFENSKVKLELIDIRGTIISTLDLTGQEYYNFDFSSFAPGIYFIKSYCNDTVFTNKLILK